MMDINTGEKRTGMEIKEVLRSLLQEMILPEFEHMKTEQAKMGERLNSVDKRLDDINSHLIDQSRRIDETNKRIDSVRDELVTMIDETNKRVDSVRDELVSMIGETNKRIDRLYEVVVRREEHGRLEMRMDNLEKRM